VASVLLVDDDKNFTQATGELLKMLGHEVVAALNLAEAAAALASRRFDILLLDLMLPDGRGLDFLKTLRAAGDTTPVIILTAKDQVSDRIAGLNAGADDYLVKPFDLSELSARVAAVARRYRGNPNPLLQFGGLEVDLTEHSVSRDGQALDLTAREWALFEVFLQRPSMLQSRAQLEDRLYEFGAEIESNTIEVYISRLRKKLGREVIVTVRGMGYRLGAYAH